MYKHTWLTADKGTARNQEIYDWLTANCSDLFDSITIDEEQNRVSCNIGDNEVLGISSAVSSLGDQIYWKEAGETDTDYGKGSLNGVYRIKNGVLFDIIPPIVTSAGSSACKKYIPSIAVIKHNGDIFFINISNETITNKSARYISTFNCVQTWNYRIHSYNNGTGSVMSKPMPGYYSYFGNNAVLTPMLCTDTSETPTEICYWIKQSPTMDTGLITINGHEYFSNGIFCVLND